MGTVYFEDKSATEHLYIKAADNSRRQSLHASFVQDTFSRAVWGFIKNARSLQPRPNYQENSIEPPAKKYRFNSKLNRIRSHPAALHHDVVFNEFLTKECLCQHPHTTNVIHGSFPGEKAVPCCDPGSNNHGKLFHYLVEVSSSLPKTWKTTFIEYNGRQYMFEGFVLILHNPVTPSILDIVFSKILPGFDVKLTETTPIEGFCVSELEMIHSYLLEGLLELYNINRGPVENTSCPVYHIFPRFVNLSTQNGCNYKCILPASHVLQHLTNCFQIVSACTSQQQSLKGSLVCNPSKRPCCVRIDADCREKFGTIRHYAVRPTHEAANAKQKLISLQKRYRLLKEKMCGHNREVSQEERDEFKDVMEELNQLKLKSAHKKSSYVELNPSEFFNTGLSCDVVHHLLIMLAMVFKKRSLLELAFTHPSYTTDFNTDIDQAKNALRNCGVNEIPESKTSTDMTKKRGVESLMEVMAEQGSELEETSDLHHNERLEFLGDAVVELITSYHLFFLLPHVEEGVLASQRSKLVRNSHLGTVGQRIQMHKFLLRHHGSEICRPDSLRKAVANAFEALMAAVYLDSDLCHSDRILSKAFFGGILDVFESWCRLPEHPLKANSPSDRHWIPKVKWLQNLTELEDYTGIYFNHIRVLAKAFTRRHVGFNNLTQGHNQTLEFLGDTVLQFFVSDYVYKHFPRHHEGHLSLLRSCLVSNKNQSVICDELGLTRYLIEPNASKVSSLGTKDRADLVESLIGALYVDRGFEYCRTFCQICFMPRLSYFILSARWNDPKSQLQQCCLALKNQGIVTNHVPEYKVIGMDGPTNSREYQVSVYFKGKKLGTGKGRTVHNAEMDAAESALTRNSYLFSQFDLEATYMGERIRELQAKHRILRDGVSEVTHEEEELKEGKVELVLEAVSDDDSE